MPTDHHELTIGSVVIGLRQVIDRIIVVDDASTDDTATIAQQTGAILIQHDETLGRSEALRTGFREARRLFPLVVVTMGADGRYDPHDIPAIVTPILERQADMVIASRSVPSEQRLSFLRPDWWYRLAVNLLTGVSLNDPRSSFRALSPWVLDQLAHSDGALVELEMQFLASRHGLRIQEVSVTCRL